MKKSMPLLVLTVLAFSQLASADFNTDAKDGAIHCTGDGVSVSINTKRTTIRLHVEGNEGPDTDYTVDKRDSDGDTFVSYNSDDYGGLILSFDDRGDNLVYKDSGETTDLDCK